MHISNVLPNLSAKTTIIIQSFVNTQQFDNQIPLLILRLNSTFYFMFVSGIYPQKQSSYSLRLHDQFNIQTNSQKSKKEKCSRA